MTNSQWIEIFIIIKKYNREESPIVGAEHDIVYLNLDADDVPEDSDDGKILDDYGCHIQDECWCRFV